jgi:hypothetical protein
MSRAQLHHDRKMQMFRDVLSRWERPELSQLEAAELLGCPERQFRRYRDRFKAEGEAGLLDRRPDKASPKAIGESEAARLRALYRSMYGVGRRSIFTNIASATTVFPGTTRGRRRSCT